MTGEVQDRVKAERERRGWSQRQAAERAGIDHGMWSKIERGVKPLTNRTRAGVAEAFGWPLDWPDQPVDEVREASRLDALEDRVADVEALLRAFMRAVVDDRERAAIAQQVAEASSEGRAPLREV